MEDDLKKRLLMALEDRVFRHKFKQILEIDDIEDRLDILENKI